MPEIFGVSLSRFWETHMSFSTELMIVGLLFMIGQPKRGHHALRLGFGLLFYCMLCWSLPFAPTWYGLLRIPVQFIFFVALLLFVLSISFKCGVFIALVSYALQNLAYNLDSFISSVAHLDSADRFLWHMLLTVLAFTVVYSLGYHFVIVPFSKNSEIYFNSAACCFLAIVTFCVTCSRLFLSSFGILSDNQLLYIFCALCVVLLLIIQFSLLEQSRGENEKKMIERLLYAEQARQALRQETIDIINMKFHDLRYHLNEYRERSADSKNAEFFEEVSESIKNYDNMPDTGNSALNVLLAEKLIYCNANDITVSYIIDASVINMMSSSDICSLFGNALDNAIQSVRREDKEKRIISISARRHGGMGQIIIENYCAEKPEMKNGLPLTSGDETIHGFGTRSIRYIAEKYGGNMVIDYSDSMFTLSVFLPVKDS